MWKQSQLPITDPEHSTRQGRSFRAGDAGSAVTRHPALRPPPPPIGQGYPPRGGCSFRWKDYRIKGHHRYKLMTLAVGEFIRRFLIHVLPKGFHRIRHYGLLAK